MWASTRPVQPLVGALRPLVQLESPTCTALVLQEMKSLLAEQLDAGGRDAESPAGRRLSELVRHVRIMRPCRLVGKQSPHQCQVLTIPGTLSDLVSVRPSYHLCTAM